MANCLLMLARGKSRHSSYPPPQPNQGGVTTKFTSRKFMEVATAGKSGGYYVYECKTCSKTFPSFQALGGHRASHKKPKIKDQDNNRIRVTCYNNNNETNNQNYYIRNNVVLSLHEEDQPSSSMKHNILSASSSSSLYSFRSGSNQQMSRPRMHECSICGVEFSSGQALGGHMRRHRGMVTNAAQPVTVVARTLAAADQAENMVVGNTMKMPTSSNTMLLELDLNLPAPAEESTVDRYRRGESTFVFVSKQLQPEQPAPQSSPPQPNDQQLPRKQLVFSSLALVDCHY